MPPTCPKTEGEKDAGGGQGRRPKAEPEPTEGAEGKPEPPRDAEQEPAAAQDPPLRRCPQSFGGRGSGARGLPTKDDKSKEGGDPTKTEALAPGSCRAGDEK